MNLTKPCIEIIGKTRCTGCFGCQSSCPMRAIEMQLDAEGFYKPLVRNKLCTGCGLCHKNCPVIVHDDRQINIGKISVPQVFAAWSRDNSLRVASSSGGLFIELARSVIDAGGSVAGCIWGDDWTPRHVLTRNWAEILKMRGSKYVPSYVGDIFLKIDKQLRESDRPVLFSGTPCQVAAMDAALNREQRSRLILVDFICHGVPSLRVFHAYLAELFQGEKVASYTLRDKSFCWQSLRAESASGRSLKLPAIGDVFFQGFVLHHLYLMESCYSCVFSQIPRSGDITLGDFWGCPEKWLDAKGVSVVLASTSAGIVALNALAMSKRIVLEPTDFFTATKHNQRAVCGEHRFAKNRRAFLDGIIGGQGFGALVAVYFPKPSFLKRCADFFLFRIRKELKTNLIKLGAFYKLAKAAKY